MTDAEILKGARAKIEQGWCQGYYARDAVGRDVSYNSPSACSYCLSGALWASATAAGLDVHAVDRCFDLLRHGVSELNPMIWQDKPERTKEEVLARFDQAIVKAEALQ